MSGIAVDVADDGADCAEVVASMMRRMAHRGPDAAALTSGHDDDLRFALGQLSLWVTPEDEGIRGPLEARGSVLLFDGRLDNREELLETLSAPSGIADRELVLRAFERWERDTPSKLVGDFAFVVWTPRDRRLFAARDRLGAVPLFFHRHAHGIRLSSEKRALLVDDRVSGRPNLRALASALADEYVEREATLLEGVEAIPPGHWLEWSSSHHVVEAYWRLPLGQRTRFADPREYAEDFREVLTKATRARLRTRGDVAVTVSGGLDSSALAAIAVGEVGGGGLEKLHLASFRFPELACDESPFSERVGRHLGRPVTAIEMPADGVLYAPRDVGDLLYDPMFALYERTKATLPAAKVVLTGFGSDELQWWTGFEVETALQEHRWIDSLRYAGLFEEPFLPDSWRRAGGAIARQLGLRASRSSRPWHIDRLPDWLTPQALALVARERDERDRALGWLQGASPVDQALAAGLTHGMQAPFGLWHMGMFGAALGVEVRQPFFDVRVVDRMLSYPIEARYDFHLSKPLLRDAVDPLLPASVTWRSGRAGFNPFFMRVAVLHQDRTRNLADSALVESLGLVAPGAFAKVAQKALYDEVTVTELGTLVATESWLRLVGGA